MTWPLVTVMDTHLYGGFLSDSIQSARHTWWIKHALQTGQSIFFQPMLGYPEGLQGAWIWSNPLEYFPGWLFAFFMPLVVACNLMLLVQIALNGWAMYWLVYHLTDKKFGAALVAGIIFMAYPAMHGRIYGGHVGVLALWPLPIYLYAMYKLRDQHQIRWYGIAAGFFALSVAGNSTLLVYYLIPTAGLFMLWLLFTRQWTWFRRGFIANLAGSALIMIFLIPLAIETNNTPQYNPDIDGSVRYSADLLSFASPSFYHPVFEVLVYPNRVLGINLVEGIGYVGIIAGALALIGFVGRREARWLLVLAVIAWLFSMGPLLKIFNEPARLGVDTYETYITMPWAFFENLPVINIARTHGRFNLTVGLAIAIMAGYGFAHIWARLGRSPVRYGVLATVAVLIAFEYQVFWGMPTIEATVPQAVHDLRKREDIRAVLHMPYDHPLLAKTGMYMQVFHQQNIMTGQFVRDTPVNPARLGLLQGTLDPVLLDEAGVDVVIWHKEFDTRGQYLDRFTRQQLGAPIYEDNQIAIFEVADVSNEVGFTPLITETQVITRQADSYLYVPEPGWVTFSGNLVATDREIGIFVNGERFNHWVVAGGNPFSITLPVSEGGYHTIRLQADPMCPTIENLTLICSGITAQNLLLGDFMPSQFNEGIAFERGIQLQGALLGDGIQAGASLPLNLAWYFEQAPPESASRFIHVLDAENKIVGQADGPLPVEDDDSHWAESPEIRLPEELPTGTYRVYAGWYTYPSLARLNVLVDVPGVENNTVLIGTFEIREGV